MEFIFELLFEFFGEIVLQVAFELLAEFGLQSIAAPFRKRPNVFLGSVGYALLGAAAGGLSLWIVPMLLMPSHAARVVNLLLTPVVSGGVMVLIGRWRQKRDQELIMLDRFAYGYLFAFTMAMVRFAFGG